MPDFFASPGGSDSNSGTSASPFRSITRAVLEAVASGGSGTVNAADGTYDAANGEIFPISIPPGYVLAGESRGGTVLQFETPSSGRGNVAIESGNGVRELTLRAGVPLPGGSTSTCTYGIGINTTDALISRVRVLPSRDPVPPEPFPPAPWPVDIGAFNWAITTNAAARATIRDCIFDFHWVSVHRDAVVERCEFRDSELWARWATVQNNEFVGRAPADMTWTALRCAVDERLTVRRNTVRGSSRVEVDAYNLPVRAGAGPQIQNNTFEDCWLAIGCQGEGATARFTNNTIRDFVGYGAAMGNGCTPVFLNNTFESTVPVRHAIVDTRGTARPVFEGCTFVQPLAAPPAYTSGFHLGSAADFGGGGDSAGGNDFSRVGSIWCPAPGREIWLRFNTFRTAVPADQVGSWGTTVVHL